MHIIYDNILLQMTRKATKTALFDVKIEEKMHWTSNQLFNFNHNNTIPETKTLLLLTLLWYEEVYKLLNGLKS
jgi:hypothetical protein